MERGDIFDVDLRPMKGREQRGRRPVLVVTTKEFNQHNAPIVCPIIGGGASARLKGFAVSLSGTALKTDGERSAISRALWISVRGAASALNARQTTSLTRFSPHCRTSLSDRRPIPSFAQSSELPPF